MLGSYGLGRSLISTIDFSPTGTIFDPQKVTTRPSRGGASQYYPTRPTRWSRGGASQYYPDGAQQVYKDAVNGSVDASPLLPEPIKPSPVIPLPALEEPAEIPFPTEDGVIRLDHNSGGAHMVTADQRDDERGEGAVVREGDEVTIGRPKMKGRTKLAIGGSIAAVIAMIAMR